MSARKSAHSRRWRRRWSTPVMRGCERAKDTRADTEVLATAISGLFPLCASARDGVRRERQ
eukprot:3887010-Rhodomonas_salina.1